jgi:tetratricopeptide (TPR) repeat protein/tRNA A-37 threonylcarbamoyl transferase component Bud32
MTDPPSTNDSENLTDEERRLNAVLGPFLEAEQAGQPADRRALLDAHPDLAEALRSFFADYDRLQALARPLRSAIADPAPLGSTATGSLAAEVPRTMHEGVGSLSPDLVATAVSDVRETIAGNSSDLNLPDSPAGTVVRYFGDYVLLSELGRGGMGVVYKARQVSLDRLVALKMLRAGTIAGEDDLRRFQTEAEAVAALDHPGIVAVHEVGEHLGRRYFSMKFVGGQSLAAHLDDYTDRFKAIARLMVAVSDAVHHAHMRGILHRDLKPANVLLDEIGQPLVTDFGLAKRVEVDSSLTQSGAILGTPSYMAPEQSLGRRASVTTAADVYGLGAILYTLLTKQPPFAGDSVIDTLEQVRTRAPEPPTRLNVRVPRDLEVICLKCLEKEPRRRYESADALGKDLQRWLDGEPIKARPVSGLVRAGMWCRRKPLIAGLLAALAVSMVGGSVGIAWNWREAIRQRDEATRSDATTRTINAFLTDDVLGQADPERNARGNRKITVEEALDRAAASVETAFVGQPLIEGALRHTIGKAYRSLTALDKAEPHLKASYEIRLRLLGPDHRDTLNSKDSLGSVYWDRSQFDKAEPLFRQTLADRRRVLGPDHPDTLESMNNLALLEQSLGHYDSALARFREAYDLGRRTSGPTDRNTLQTLSNLGTLLRVRGKSEEAEPLIRECLALCESVFGPRNPTSLSVLDNYASVLQEVGKQAESEEAFRRAVAARLDVLGPDHIHTTVSKGNLALLLFERGKFDEALRLSEECLETKRRPGGALHINTLTFMTTLCMIYRGQGRIADAEAVAHECLEGARKGLGAESPVTLTALNNEAILLQDLGRLDEAERLFREAYDGRRKVLGVDDPLTSLTAVNLAVLLLAKELPDRARVVLRESLPNQRRTLKPSNQTLHGSILMLGRAELKLGHLEEAERLLGEANAVLPTDLGANLLGECLSALGRYAEAEPLLLQSTPPLVVALRSNPIKAAAITRKLELMYTSWGKPDMAEPWRLKALDLSFPADPFATPAADTRGKSPPAPR